MSTKDLVQLIILLAPVLGQLLNTTFHVVWNHVTHGGAHLGSIVVSFLIGFFFQNALVILILQWSGTMTTEWVGALAWTAVTYAGFGFCYFTFVNLARTSLRIKILLELFQAKNYCLAPDQLFNIYSENDISRLRLERLEKWGQIERRGDRLFPAGRAFWLLGRMIRFVRHALDRVPAPKKGQAPPPKKRPIG